MSNWWTQNGFIDPIGSNVHEFPLPDYEYWDDYDNRNEYEEDEEEEEYDED